MKTSLYLLLFFPLGLQAQLLRPGDANNDGRVDHLDVLAIGLSFGQEGPPREPPFQGFDWMLKPFEPWAGSLPGTMINYGFSDCDGDGLVSPEDVEALQANYDSTHMDSQPPPMPWSPPDTAFLSALPRLVFTFEPDTATVQDTLRLHISYVHPPGLPADESPLGVAFTLEFDEMLVKDSLTVVFFPDTVTDLLFAAGATGFADARAVPPGMVEYGAAGKGQPALAYSRPLGVVQFIIEDIIVRPDTFWTDFKIDVANPVMIDAKEQVIPFNILVDEVVLFQELSAVPAVPAPLAVKLYPLPAQDVLHIESPETPLTGLRIFDVFGKLVAARELAGDRRVDLPVGQWAPGVYWVQIFGKNGRLATRKFLKI
ncbi:MAG: T9SS type A sorting domain-containing protein [Saprospiraceae bacterium]